MVKWLKVLFIPVSLIPIIFNFSLASELHTIKRVIDGDTLLMGNRERVRLVGVDTPEVHNSAKLKRDVERTQTDIETIRKLGKKSSAFVKKMVQGKLVRLEYDQANAAINHRVRYGRTLAYSGGCNLYQCEIIRRGYGVAYTKYPFKYAEMGKRGQRKEKRTMGKLSWG